MRLALVAAAVALAACRSPAVRGPQPAAPRRAGGAPALDQAALCSAQRAENLRRTRAAAACAIDEDCVHAGQYETGSCDAWVRRAAADAMFRQMRVTTDAACRDLAKAIVADACPAVEAACLAGHCAGRPAGAGVATPAGSLVPVVPERFRCVASELRKVTSAKKVALGRIELRFPLAPDGRPLRYFEAVGPHDPDAAAGVARAFGACRWRPQNGGAIPPEAWGSMSLTLKE